MSRVVIDASVAVKWAFPERRSEQHTGRALDLLQAVRSGEVRVLQPPHWVAEVAAVAARLDAEAAPHLADLLLALELPVRNDSAMYREACRLASSLGQHLFDTLYHAVALTTADAHLVTADERYHRAARHLGSISLLRDFAR